MIKWHSRTPRSNTTYINVWKTFISTWDISPERSRCMTLRKVLSWIQSGSGWFQPTHSCEKKIICASIGNSIHLTSSPLLKSSWWHSLCCLFCDDKNSRVFDVYVSTISNFNKSTFFNETYTTTNRVPFRLIPGVRCTKRKFFGSLGATDTRKLNFNFKVLNRRIFTRRIRISCGPPGVQRNNRFFQYKY